MKRKVSRDSRLMVGDKIVVTAQETGVNATSNVYNVWRQKSTGKYVEALHVQLVALFKLN